MRTKKIIADPNASITKGIDDTNSEALNVILTDTPAEDTPTDDAVIKDKRVAKRVTKKASADDDDAEKKKVTERGVNVTMGNAQKFNSRINQMGAAYNPPNPLITTAALAALYTLAMASVAALRKGLTLYKQALKQRFTLYTDLLPFVTRLFNEYKACGASAADIMLADSLVKKIRGKRVIALDPNETNVNRISACQTSFVNKLAFYANLMDLVLADPLYLPSVDDLKPTALVERYDQMDRANAHANDHQAIVDMLRVNRNDIFNAPTVGLVDVYQTSKHAVLAIYGATSGAYKLVRGLRFDRIY